MSDKYREAGVDLEAGYESVRLIKSHVARTKVRGAIDSIGAFGGMFDLSVLNMKEPVLVSGTDGVGTKLLVAFEMDKHDTVVLMLWQCASMMFWYRGQHQSSSWIIWQ